MTPTAMAAQIERLATRRDGGNDIFAHGVRSFLPTILRALRALDAEPSDAAVASAALRIADAVMCPAGKPAPNGCGTEDSPCYCERAARAALAAARDGAAEGRG